jgi:hypothetical protein
MTTEVGTTLGARDNAVRRILRERRLKRALERYEKYLRIKAREFA